MLHPAVVVATLSDTVALSLSGVSIFADTLGIAVAFAADIAFVVGDGMLNAGMVMVWSPIYQARHRAS